jgi:predicted nucleic acid-binding protein
MAERLMFDTSVLIDFLRGRPSAVEFLRTTTSRPLASAVTVGELYAGVREGKERGQLDRLVSAFRIIGLTRDVAVQGGLLTRQFRKSHGVGLSDALIAATAVSVNARLVTLNVKHFPMLPDVLLPYTSP